MTGGRCVIFQPLADWRRGTPSARAGVYSHAVTQEERFDVTLRTRELIALVERCLAGGTHRDDLVAWARARGDAPFRGNPAAASLQTCLWDMDDARVRPADLAEHLRAVREGEPPFDREELALLKLTIAEVSQRAQQPASRFFEIGLGLYEAVRFASPATGRPFAAMASMERTESGDGRTVPVAIRSSRSPFLSVSSSKGVNSIPPRSTTSAPDSSLHTALCERQRKFPNTPLKCARTRISKPYDDHGLAPATLSADRPPTTMHDRGLAG